MVDIKKICLNLNNELSKSDTPEDILLTCATDKLTSLYTVQSNQLDNIIGELYRSLDLGDLEYTYKVIKRLSRNLTTNRKQLIRLIEEVGCYGQVGR